jgi:hypothetical protein
MPCTLGNIDDHKSLIDVFGSMSGVAMGSLDSSGFIGSGDGATGTDVCAIGCGS